MTPARLFASVLVALAPSSRSLRRRARTRPPPAQQFKKGVELYDKKQYAEALEHFRTAYREKPSAGIKQNIALCLKGLGRPVEAATAFDEALDEGQGTLKPETQRGDRARARRPLEDRRDGSRSRSSTSRASRSTASRSRSSARRPAASGTRAFASGAHRRPIRLEPGIYDLHGARARATRIPRRRSSALVAGSPVDATFVLVGRRAPRDRSRAPERHRRDRQGRWRRGRARRVERDRRRREPQGRGLRAGPQDDDARRRRHRRRVD